MVARPHGRMGHAGVRAHGRVGHAWTSLLTLRRWHARVQGIRDLPSLGSLQGRLSWTVINTVYTLRYADQHFRSKLGGIAFGTEDGQQQPSYRDFAYVAFTIGMTYQVSDTTLRDPQIRRSVLAHAVLSYVFDVVIVAGSVNLISGLFRQPPPAPPLPPRTRGRSCCPIAGYMRSD
jgi:hypothetical protein